MASIQGTNCRPFTPKEIAKRTGYKPNKIRAWLSRDRVKGLVTKTDSGKYRIVSVEVIGEEIDKIKRNSATRGSTWGSTEAKKKPSLCRLHNVQFYSRLPYGGMADRKAFKSKFWDWGSNTSPGVQHWFKETAIQSLKAKGKLHIALGQSKAALQMWVNPLWTNSHRIFDQLEAVHHSAQETLRWLAHEYEIEISLLEVRRKAHFGIRIPVKEGWRLGNLGYGMRGGKLWVNQDWWIDESYGPELETANQDAFSELVGMPVRVRAMEPKVDKILSILESLPDAKPGQPPAPPSGEEVA